MQHNEWESNDWQPFERGQLYPSLGLECGVGTDEEGNRAELIGLLIDDGEPLLYLTLRAAKSCSSYLMRRLTFR